MNKNELKKLMKESHQLAKKFIGDYVACLTLAMRLKWKAFKNRVKTYKQYLVNIIIDGKVTRTQISLKNPHQFTKNVMNSIKEHKGEKYFRNLSKWFYSKNIENKMLKFLKMKGKYTISDGIWISQCK